MDSSDIILFPIKKKKSWYETSDPIIVQHFSEFIREWERDKTTRNKSASRERDAPRSISPPLPPLSTPVSIVAETLLYIVRSNSVTRRARLSGRYKTATPTEWAALL